MKELYICNTVYQLMVVCCIKRYLDDGSDAVLWISDHTNQAEQIYCAMQHVDMGFRKIEFIKTKIYQETKYTNQQIVKENKNKVRMQLRELGEDFAHIYMANFDFFMSTLLEEWKERDIVYSLYEDGLGTYSYEGNVFEDKKNRRQADVIRNIYVFYPDKLSWKTKKPKIQVPCRLEADVELKQNFNRIFSYAELKDRYDAKYIFFEDGFAEWDAGEDMNLLRFVSREVGKENILIKTHPRNSSQKYLDAGYHVNTDTYVPWEIIAMNINVEHKVLITFYSQAVIMPYMLLGVKYRAVILGKILSCNDERAEQYFRYMDDYYYSQHKDIFFVPESVEELKRYLENLQEEETEE